MTKTKDLYEKYYTRFPKFSSLSLSLSLWGFRVLRLGPCASCHDSSPIRIRVWPRASSVEREACEEDKRSLLQCSSLSSSSLDLFWWLARLLWVFRRAVFWWWVRVRVRGSEGLRSSQYLIIIIVSSSCLHLLDINLRLFMRFAWLSPWKKWYFKSWASRIVRNVVGFVHFITICGLLDAI